VLVMQAMLPGAGATRLEACAPSSAHLPLLCRVSLVHGQRGCLLVGVGVGEGWQEGWDVCRRALCLVEEGGGAQGLGVHRVLRYGVREWHALALQRRTRGAARLLTRGRPAVGEHRTPCRLYPRAHLQLHILPQLLRCEAQVLQGQQDVSDVKLRPARRLCIVVRAIAQLLQQAHEQVGQDVDRRLLARLRPLQLRDLGDHHFSQGP